MTIRSTRWIPAALSAALVCASSSLAAQILGDTVLPPVSDAIRQAHLIHVSPHVIFFTPGSRTATLELTNQGTTTTTAQLFLQLGYTIWPDVDTSLFSKRWKDGRARDTVIENPGPKDRYAGRWISGVPTTVTLGPKESKKITLRIDPPANLPDGEYYARLVTQVAPPSPKPSDTKTKDVRTVYRLPIKGFTQAPLRDSARIFYRTGKVTMGVRLSNGKADLNQEKAEAVHGAHPDYVWTMFHYEMTGNAHLEGTMLASYFTASGQEIPLNVEPGALMSIHGSGTMRWFAQSNPLQPGHYTFVVRFMPRQDDFPPAQRLPMETAEIKIPFDVRQ